MTEPGGERQDPRLDVVVYAMKNWGTPWGHDETVSLARAVLVAADAVSSVPVGGAPPLSNRARLIEALAAEIGNHSTEHEEGMDDWLDEAYRWVEWLEGEQYEFVAEGAPRDDQNDDVEALPDGRGFTDELMEAQADLQSALGIARLNGWGQPQEDRVARCLARLHALLAALGRPMYDPATHPDVAYPASPASVSTNPSSGAAPKGEQEVQRLQAEIDRLLEFNVPTTRLRGRIQERLAKIETGGYSVTEMAHDLESALHVFQGIAGPCYRDGCQAGNPPPPDRLTDEEARLLYEHLAGPPLEEDHAEAFTAIRASLRAFLSEREE